MDAHLIGIDLAQLLLKHKASGDKGGLSKQPNALRSPRFVKQMEQTRAESR